MVYLTEGTAQRKTTALSKTSTPPAHKGSSNSADGRDNAFIEQLTHGKSLARVFRGSLSPLLILLADSIVCVAISVRTDASR